MLRAALTQVNEGVAMSNVQALPKNPDERRRERSPKEEALDALVKAVAADAQVAPQNYLRETRVPAGGE